MPPKPPFNLAGTVPEEHGLELIQAELLAHPRRRHFAVVEIVSASDTRHHPADEPSYKSVTVRIVDMEPVTVPDDVNTVREIRDRARLNRPGAQLTLDGQPQDDELAARRAAEQGGGRA